jgi:hypothetical protein
MICFICYIGPLCVLIPPTSPYPPYHPQFNCPPPPSKQKMPLFSVGKIHLGTHCQGRPYLPWHQKSAIRKEMEDWTQSYASALCDLWGTDTTIQTVCALSRLLEVYPVLQYALGVRSQPRLTVFRIHHAWYKDASIPVSDHTGTFVKSPPKKKHVLSLVLFWYVYKQVLLSYHVWP